MFRRQLDHLVDTGEECFVGRGQIIIIPIGPAGDMARKGTNAVVGASIISASHGGTGSEEIDPIRVETVRMPIGEKPIPHPPVTDVRRQGLGGIADNQIGSMVLVTRYRPSALILTG